MSHVIAFLTSVARDPEAVSSIALVAHEPILSALAAVYGGNYLLAYRGRKSLGSSWFFYNTFVAGMVMVIFWVIGQLTPRAQWVRWNLGEIKAQLERRYA